MGTRQDMAGGYPSLYKNTLLWYVNQFWQQNEMVHPLCIYTLHPVHIYMLVEMPRIKTLKLGNI